MKIKINEINFECPNCHEGIRITVKSSDLKKGREVIPLLVDKL